MIVYSIIESVNKSILKRQILTYVILIFSALSLIGQTRYRTTSGEINFNASTPLEDIDATNEEVNAILELETGKFATVMLIQDFQFRRKLMQEHFNENYMETDQFPKAFFTGTIKDLDITDSSEENQNKQIAGEITIHGVKRPLKTMGNIQRGKHSVVIRAEFVIRPEEHGIEVPSIVFQKIAREVDVKVKLILRKSN